MREKAGESGMETEASDMAERLDNRSRIVVVDDHALVREGVAKLIERNPQWVLCGSGQSGCEAVELAERLHPDLMVLDFSMPEGNGVEAARAILDRHPEIRIIMITGFDPDSILREAADAGVKGLILKSDAGQRLERAIETVLQGGTFFSVRGLGESRFSYGERTQNRRIPLSAREKEIVGLIGDGLTSNAIAEKLGISVRTVQTHRGNIMRKLNMRSVVDVVRYAIRHDLTRT